MPIRLLNLYQIGCRFLWSGRLQLWVSFMWLEPCGLKIVIMKRKKFLSFGGTLLIICFFPKDPVCSSKGASMGMDGVKQGKTSSVQLISPDDQLRGATNSAFDIPLVKSKDLKVNLNGDSSSRATVRSDKQSQLCAPNGKEKDQWKTQLQTSNIIQDVQSSRRAEIIEWVSQGGGAVVDEQAEQNVHFTVECHGVVPSPADASKSTHVSSHWIRSCLEVP
ncbi:transcription coactivator [Actinidia rufa]|uniref:Transcription coactivator n=1 Tax=Actinidia rufa TaxID=165716 RepID=A0A7J0FEF5_9ERIC|nr:transcription coactivator [Actinidia rufa]